jgi:methionyl-tRNA formyltransferase
MLRLLFFGTPEFAAASLDALIASVHAVVGVVTQPDRPSGRGHQVVPSPVKRLASAHAVPVWQPTRLKDEAFLDELRALAPDLGVVAAYGRILPEVVLALPRLGLVNVHASLLPAWRGASPVHRAVMAGDHETGVTIMRVVEELDAGPILASVRCPIGADDTSTDVERRLAGLGASLLLTTIDALERGGLQEVDQDHTRATFAPRLAKEEGSVDWSLPARVIRNRIRGLQPWPLASTWLGDARLILLAAQVVDAPPTADAPSGTIVETRPRLVVACGAGTGLELTQVQPAGRRVMTAREFVAGHRLGTGARLGRAVAAP